MKARLSLVSWCLIRGRWNDFNQKCLFKTDFQLIRCSAATVSSIVHFLVGCICGNTHSVPLCSSHPLLYFSGARMFEHLCFHFQECFKGSWASHKLLHKKASRYHHLERLRGDGSLAGTLRSTLEMIGDVVGSAASDDCFCVLSEEEKNQNESKNCLERDVNTDPWPGYRYTGKLRPHYPLVRPRRSLCVHDSSNMT